MSTFSFNNAEFEINLLDADTMELYENAMDEVVTKANEGMAYQGKKAHEALRLQCAILNDFFDKLFGRGAASAMFGEGNMNLEDHMEAFADVVELANQTTKQISQIANKYSQQRVKERYNNNMNGHKKKGGQRRYN